MMDIKLLGIAFMAICAVCSDAPDAVQSDRLIRVDAAAEVMRVSGVIENLDRAFDEFSAKIELGTTTSNLRNSGEARKILSELDRKYREYKPEIINEIAAIYADRFTLEELRIIAEFYSSPVGVKLVRETPEFRELGVEIGTNYFLKAMGDLNMTQDIPYFP